jgi:hypothetical protein
VVNGVGAGHNRPGCPDPGNCFQADYQPAEQPPLWCLSERQCPQSVLQPWRFWKCWWAPRCATVCPKVARRILRGSPDPGYCFPAAPQPFPFHSRSLRASTRPGVCFACSSTLSASFSWRPIAAAARQSSIGLGRVDLNQHFVGHASHASRVTVIRKGGANRLAACSTGRALRHWGSSRANCDPSDQRREPDRPHSGPC